MEKYLNNVILGDNVKIMKRINDNSIDLIFADPPYNMNLKKKLLRFDGTKFDGVDDEWDKYTSLKEYDDECKKWLEQCLRILKKDGSLWVIGSFQNIHRLGYILQDMKAWIINEIVWEKTNPVPNFAGTRFVNAQETMLWVTKNEKSKFTFNYKTMKHINGGTQMKSVWKLPICSGKERLREEGGKKIHSTQKPIALLERVILSSSKPGDIVLDPFSGTGTTAHVAKQLGRKYIAIEKEEKYYNASLKRISRVVEDYSREDIKNAVYDNKPKIIKFKDLITNQLISTNDRIELNSKYYKFNEEGLILHKGEYLTPNKLCNIIFKKSTNAWTAITINGNKLSYFRDIIRTDLK
ncbi:MAG: DNA-methyltransferase [Metamycoplasmataceae bacterium]